MLALLALCGVACGFADTADSLLSVPYVVKTSVYGAAVGLGLYVLLEPPSAFGSDEFGSQLLIGSLLVIGGGLLATPPAGVLANLLLGHPMDLATFRILTAVEDGAIVVLSLVGSGNSVLIPLVGIALFALDLLPFSVESNRATQAPSN